MMKMITGNGLCYKDMMYVIYLNMLLEKIILIYNETNNQRKA